MQRPSFRRGAVSPLVVVRRPKPPQHPRSATCPTLRGAGLPTPRWRGFAATGENPASGRASCCRPPKHRPFFDPWFSPRNTARWFWKISLPRAALLFGFFGTRSHPRPLARLRLGEKVGRALRRRPPTINVDEGVRHATSCRASRGPPLRRTPPDTVADL